MAQLGTLRNALCSWLHLSLSTWRDLEEIGNDPRWPDCRAWSAHEGNPTFRLSARITTAAIAHICNGVSHRTMSCM